MADERSPILRATSPMLIPGTKNLLDLKFASTRTVDERQRQITWAQAALTNPAIRRDRKDFTMKHALAGALTLTVCLGLAFTFNPSRAQHAGTPSMPPHGGATTQPAGPANAVVEFENESIVVVRIRMAP